MLRITRIIIAVIFTTLLTLLFLDFTGSLHKYFHWLGHIQFVPALLGGFFGLVGILLILTLVFGRWYCSIICPLGVFQDLMGRISKLFNKKKRFFYSKPLPWLRWGVVLLVIMAFFVGYNFIVSIFDPYAAYGRMTNTFLQPIYEYANNFFAYLARRADSYAFYQTEIVFQDGAVLIIAIVSFVVVSIMAWRRGRSYCNTVCPVGTVLGFISKFSFFKIRMITANCNKCGLCERTCKASCIDSKNQKIDYSRCVACMNCLGACKLQGLSYSAPQKSVVATGEENTDTTRRSFLSIAGLFAVSTVVKAQDIKMDGGLAVIEDKKIPNRQTAILPAGSHNVRQFSQRCTACQMCVSVCPNHVLRPSNELDSLMQPHLSFERGFCRPECTKCSEVCPSRAIQRVTREEKSSIKIGSAVWIKKNCLVFVDGVRCDNCARQCPAGAIQMIPVDGNDESSLAFPSIDNERCIGCGACEFLCPSRPFSAIFVNGTETHRMI